MERDKRRSKEDEEELDRKIALIREKNQKIEQRTKEIEADRVSSIDPAPKKSPKQPTSSTPSKKGENSREWDHGKTPADTWRENVPSIDLTDRLAGRGGRGVQRGAHRGANKDANNRQRHVEQGKGGRLEGRVTRESTDSPRGGAVRGGRHRGRGGATTRGDREVKAKGGELQISIKNIEPQRRDNRRTPNNRDRNDGAEKGKQPGKDHKKKPRKRHESDNYAVRNTVAKLLDRVVRMEKAEKRKKEKEDEGEKENVQGEEKKEEKVEEEKEERKDASTDNVAEEPSKEKSPEEETPKTDVKNEKSNSQEAESVQKEESEKKESATQDANQNVITLAKEKVLKIEMST